jgi:WD40 repeat protein
MATCREKETLLGHAEEVWSVAISKDRKKLVSGGKDAAVNIWPSSKRQLSEVALNMADAVEPWDVSPDSTALAVIGPDGVISLWDAASGQKQTALPALGTNNVTVFWSPTGEILAGSREPSQLSIWNLANATLTTHTLNPGGTPLRWRFLPNTGKVLIGAHAGGTLIGPRPGGTNWTFSRWDIRSRREVSKLTVNQDVSELTVSDDEHLLVLGTEQGDILLFNLETGQQEASFKAHWEPVIGLALSPDGKFLMTSVPFPTVKVWDLAAKRVLTQLRGHKLVIQWIAISADGSRLATASIGREPIKTWDTKSWEELASIGIDGARLFRPRFLPDGSTLAAMGANQTLHLLRAPSWEEIAVAERKERAELNQAAR